MSAGQDHTKLARRRRRDTTDTTVQKTGGAKTDRVSFGLALFKENYAVPGIQYTRQEIAAWAGCSDAAIYQIETRVLRKLRMRGSFDVVKAGGAR